MCQKLYFPTEDCSEAILIIVTAGLWDMFNMFGSHDLQQHGIDELELDRAKAICKQSLEDAARCTPLLLDHSYRQIQALLFLVSKQCITSINNQLTKIGTLSNTDVASVTGLVVFVGMRPTMPRSRLSLSELQQLRSRRWTKNHHFLDCLPNRPGTLSELWSESIFA
jgi:hypothetical protein